MVKARIYSYSLTPIVSKKGQPKTSGHLRRPAKRCPLPKDVLLPITKVLAQGSPNCSPGATYTAKVLSSPHLHSLSLCPLLPFPTQIKG